MTTFNFSIPKQTQQLWQTISAHWSHQSYPSGHRFLGSVKISQKATDQVLDVVGHNLRKLSKITYNNLHKEFDEPEQNWLKILTFALSEYAYYYSSVEDKFWDGFCQRLNLTYNQGIEKALRNITGEGFNVLGIVKAKGGYSYVSTLWLQSGIPHQNLQHFAQLVQVFSNEYGWWEIAHTSCEDIAEELLIFCQDKHPHWGTLINFLKSSCSQQEEKEVEPISGQLLQGIAIIAVELERKGTLPEELKSDNEREKLLGNYYLPNNFFLRNWDSLIQVLTPKQRRQGSRKIISRHQKSLSLILDVTDSLNMQLVLPEQNLWKKGWDNLGGTFCQIPEVMWEGIIPSKPGLMIPEQVMDVRNITELSTWQLLDHNRQCLTEWKIEGVESNFPYVIFDARTGDRLLNSTNLGIRGTTEIIFFTPKGTRLNLGDGIEILDSCVPSSIRDWRGQHLTLTTKESSISYHVENAQDISINWIYSVELQPSLRGLQLKGKKPIFIEIPAFWYPPSLEVAISLNISIENISQQQNIITTTENIPPSSSWQPIFINNWITKPGKYEARFWNQLNRWSYKFEIRGDFQINGELCGNNLLSISSSQRKLKEIPIMLDSPTKFWSEEIQIGGLFPLEIISLSLRDQRETVFSQCQADSLGHLTINLASLYDLLSSDSDWYALNYQRLGGEPETLMEMKITPLSISQIWNDQSIQIFGLLAHENYFLSCWNLLLPENPPLQIPILLSSSNEEIITVPLELPKGIYHIQLFSSLTLLDNLGWWCGSHEPDLPDETFENQDLENYCYTILGNESVNAFVEAANKFDYDYSLLKKAIDSLKESLCYFPAWLDINSLREKLQALIENIKVDMKSTVSTEKVTISKVNNFNNMATNQQNWLLIRLSNPKKRDLICKLINNRQQVDSILHIPKQQIYNDILLMESKNVNDVSRYSALEYIQKIQHISSREAQKILIN